MFAVEGDAFTFTLVRDRPNGGSMTYAMKGEFADDELSGTARTEFEGSGEITSEWNADRPTSSAAAEKTERQNNGGS